MIAAELFAGSGGMSVGALAAGIEVRLALEIDKHAAATYASNHPNVPLLQCDIRELPELPLKQFKQPTLLLGGPPCQGFSTSNQRNRSVSNSKNWLFKDVFRLARRWNPDWILLENVKGLIETEGGLFLDQILDGLRKYGYTSTWKVLNSADYGVAQRRERLFIVGSRHGMEFQFPAPTAGRKRVTVREAIDDLPHLDNGSSACELAYSGPAQNRYARHLRSGQKVVSNNLVTRNAAFVTERYKHIPQGGNWEDIPSRLMKNYTDATRCHTGIYHRLMMDEPSIVIGNYRKNMLIHPIENRGLSVREAARIQSFPDSYKFVGSIGFQQQQVGNAVPPLLAKAVFEQLQMQAV